MLSIANPEARNTSLSTLDSERLRRCFWATWFTQSINGDHTVHGRSQNERVMNLPLPMSEEAYENALDEPVTTPSAVLNPEASVVPGSSTQPSVMAELMTLMMFWLVWHSPNLPYLPYIGGIHETFSSSEHDYPTRNFSPNCSV